MSARSCTPCNSLVAGGCFHDARAEAGHVPVPMNVKPSTDPRKVKVLFDPALGGWMGFEVPDPVHPAWYSSLDTLPHALRPLVEVAGSMCAEPECFNKRWRRSAQCRKHTEAGKARRRDGAGFAAGQRGRFAQNPEGVGSSTFLPPPTLGAALSVVGGAA